MKYTIHETYEYLVEADSLDEALDAFHQAMEENADSTNGVVFTQNYTTVLDSDGKEI